MKKLLLPLLLGSLLGASTAHAENLIQVYELALQNDPQLKAALATRNAALEAKPQAESRFLPSINLSSGANMIRSDVNHSASGASLNHYGTGSLALNLSQSVYRKEYGIQLDQADKQIAQAEVAYAAEEQDLILRVAQAYF
ncbi:MAG: TolC family protein, partial [Sedimenticola sp.]|nr:TolC family protein [Sedimenticola sp.]MCW8947307.1 TolC family protein [Sedimenticola sp.]MCW8949495.1 TolC family protein [Sedimenticola sp.]MCW9022961.1 TolC family protein [Sedimenticola sp.]